MQEVLEDHIADTQESFFQSFHTKCSYIVLIPDIIGLENYFLLPFNQS